MSGYPVPFLPPVLSKKVLLHYRNFKFDVLAIRMKLGSMCDAGSIEDYECVLTMDTNAEDLHLIVLVRALKWINCSHHMKWIFQGETPLIYPVFGERFVMEWFHNVRTRWPKMNTVCSLDMGQINIEVLKTDTAVKPDIEHDREWVYPKREKKDDVVETNQMKEETDDSETHVDKGKRKSVAIEMKMESTSTAGKRKKG